MPPEAGSTLEYVNPVCDLPFADPFVFLADGRYYAVGTGAAESAGAPASKVFPMLGSTDLVHWTQLDAALVRPDPALGDTFWAPEIAVRDGVFFLYYSVGRGDAGHHLRVARADRPEGPYRDVGALTDPASCPFAIDPHPFRDVDGRDYLFYARDFLDAEATTRAGTALVVQELAGMTRLLGEPRTVARAHHDWQRYLDERPMYGATYDWHTLEGPCVVLKDGVYHCMYSGGNWQTAGYGVDYVTSTNVMGPWQDDARADGPRVLRGIAEHVLGPGHHSVVRGPDGEQLFVCYHAWDPAMTARRLCIDPLVFTSDGPRCDGPSIGARTIRGRLRPGGT